MKFYFSCLSKTFRLAAVKTGVRIGAPSFNNYSHKDKLPSWTAVIRSMLLAVSFEFTLAVSSSVEVRIVSVKIKIA